MMKRDFYVPLSTFYNKEVTKRTFLLAAIIEMI